MNHSFNHSFICWIAIHRSLQVLATAVGLPVAVGLLVLLTWNAYLALRNQTTIEYHEGAQQGHGQHPWEGLGKVHNQSMTNTTGVHHRGPGTGLLPFKGRACVPAAALPAVLRPRCLVITAHTHFCTFNPPPTNPFAPHPHPHPHPTSTPQTPPSLHRRAHPPAAGVEARFVEAGTAAAQQRHPFDLGWHGNLAAVCGDSLGGWLLPGQPAAEGDGCAFGTPWDAAASAASAAEGAPRGS